MLSNELLSFNQNHFARDFNGNIKKLLIHMSNRYRLQSKTDKQFLNQRNLQH